MRKREAKSKPPNQAARALHDGLFQQRVVKAKKTYSRKIKHKKGERDDHTAPLFLWAISNQRTLEDKSKMSSY